MIFNERTLFNTRHVFTLAALTIGGCSAVPGSDANTAAKGEEIVRGTMFDPDSANFRNVIATTITAEGTGMELKLVCGEVNGKNRMGAYVGFKKFFVFPELGDESGLHMEPSEKPRQEDSIEMIVFDRDWETYCRK